MDTCVTGNSTWWRQRGGYWWWQRGGYWEVRHGTRSCPTLWLVDVWWISNSVQEPSFSGSSVLEPDLQQNPHTGDTLTSPSAATEKLRWLGKIKMEQQTDRKQIYSWHKCSNLNNISIQLNGQIVTWIQTDRQIGKQAGTQWKQSNVVEKRKQKNCQRCHVNFLHNSNNRDGQSSIVKSSISLGYSDNIPKNNLLITFSKL